jgi:dihydroflavonol-4-reductase
MGTMTAAVVGSQSAIGQHLVSRLSQIRVRVITDPFPVEPADLVQKMKGIDVVFHLIDSSSSSNRPKADLVRWNKILLECAYQAEIGTLIHSSPAVAMGFSDRSDLVRDETSPPRRRMSSEDRAITSAEEASLEFGEWTGMSVLAVRSALTISPIEFEASLADQPIRAALARRSVESFDAGITIAHAQDIADGHILAWRRGDAGETYILGGQRVEIPNYIDLVNELTATIPKRPAPSRSTWWPKFSLGVNASATADSPQKWSDLAGRYAWFTCEKAIAELGYHDRSVEESVLDIVDDRSSESTQRRAA